MVKSDHQRDPKAGEPSHGYPQSSAYLSTSNIVESSAVKLTRASIASRSGDGVRTSAANTIINIEGTSIEIEEWSIGVDSGVGECKWKSETWATSWDGRSDAELGRHDTAFDKLLTAGGVDVGLDGVIGSRLLWIQS